MNDICGKCKKSSRNDQLDIKCAGICNKTFHKKCLLLSDYDVDLIRKNNGIHFVCDECTSKFEIIRKNNDKMVKIMDKINLLNINDMNAKIDEILTYNSTIKGTVINEIKNSMCDTKKIKIIERQ